MLCLVSRPQDLATRIRNAREDLGLTQDELARRMGVHRRTVQGWESRHVPRTAIPALERFFGIDLSSPPQSSTPRLDEATDAQVLSDVARRLAEREREVRDLRRQLQRQAGAPVPGGEDGTVVTPERWAARPRVPDPE